MTKPSYEELERKIAWQERLYATEVAENTAHIAENYGLKSELARVRGLLQRRDEDWQGLIQDAIGQWGGPQYKFFNEAMARILDAKKNFDKGLDLWGDPLDEPTNSETTVSPDNPNSQREHGGITPADKSVEYSSQNPNFPQSSSLVPQGAESADIGKLDRADKSGKVNRVPEKCQTLDLPGGFLGQRCGQCDSLFVNANFKFCSECGAHLVYVMEGK